MSLRLKPLACALAIALASAPALADLGDRFRDRLAGPGYFERIATFPVFRNTAIDDEAVAEIVAASEDGNTLVYTDSAGERVGFVDITDPADPQPAGTIALAGEPTSVAVAGDYALVAVNTSPSFIAPSGELVVVHIASQTVVATHALGGQPDSVAVSPDRRYAAVVIENERDEDLGSGEPPQAPGGFLTIVDLVGAPPAWSLRPVSLDGVADLFAEDPEPEYVDINGSNLAAVTMQENNHVVLVDLPTGNVRRDFSAGSVDLSQVDNNENESIELDGAIEDRPREPDGIAWIGSLQMATADEGDLFGGSRGITFFNTLGNVTYSSGNELEHAVVRLGHYPEDRSENKGNESENVEYGQFGGDKLLFVASERSSVIFVYKLQGPLRPPTLVQVLPSAVAPEGVLAIPKRNLVVAASEEESREDLVRGSLTIYKRTGRMTYPTVASADRADGTPIPWGALSGLAADPASPGIVYTMHDSYYKHSRIFRMDVTATPAVISDEIVLKDNLGLLAAAQPTLVNADATVNLDMEGIALRAGGGFWIASEGDDDPLFQNLLLGVTAGGEIDRVVRLPASTEARLKRFGFEGVASVGPAGSEQVFVAFQREWTDDPSRRVRIGRYDTLGNTWTFFYYPTEAPTSPLGGWVGLSDLVALGGEEFAVVERDNQAGADARIKRIYRFSISGLTPLADPPVGTTPTFPVVTKVLVRDLMPDLEAPAGTVLEKIEGLSVLSDGDTLIVNDNDGVDGSNGETQLIRLEGLF